MTTQCIAFWKWILLRTRLLTPFGILSNGLTKGAGNGNTVLLVEVDPQDGFMDLARNSAKGVLERRQLTVRCEHQVSNESSKSKPSWPRRPGSCLGIPFFIWSFGVLVLHENDASGKAPEFGCMGVPSRCPRLAWVSSDTLASFLGRGCLHRDLSLEGRLLASSLRLFGSAKLPSLSERPVMLPPTLTG